MIAVILCGGYGSRLRPFTNNVPKALLEFGSIYLIDYIIYQIDKSAIIDDIIVVTNGRYFENFSDWKDKAEKNRHINIEIISDGTMTEETQLGAVAEIAFLLEHKNINDDVLIIAGDNYFEFNLYLMYNLFITKNSIVIAVCNLRDNGLLSRKYGVVEIDQNNKINYFDEKPKNPKTSLASTACYMIKQNDLIELQRYLRNASDKDTLGEYIKWLVRSGNVVHGFVFNEAWYDIGTIDMYIEFNIFIENKLKKIPYLSLICN